MNHLKIAEECGRDAEGSPCNAALQQGISESNLLLW
jgi:hypothetical protein